MSHREIVLVTIQDGCKGFVFPFTEEQVANLEIIANISTSVSIVALTIHFLCAQNQCLNHLNFSHPIETLVCKPSPFGQNLGEQKISQTTNSLKFSQHPPPVTPKPLIPVNNTNEHKRFFIGYNRKKFNHMMEGFKFGFDVGYKGTLSPKMIDNLASVKAKPDIVNEKIKKELEEK